MATKESTPATPLGPKPKVLVGQLRILLEAIEDDSTLFNSRNSHMNTIMNVEKWNQLAEKLNEFPNGAVISVASWKYVLRYWQVNTKKKRKHEKKTVTCARNKNLCDEEANELAQLEKRFYRFIKREESREVLEVTRHGIKYPVMKASRNNIPESVKLIVEMFNVVSNENEENTEPTAPKKRALVSEENDPDESPEKAGKLKIIIDKVNLSGRTDVPQRVVIQNDPNMRKLNVVSRELEEHISTIQNRIHMIKDLWKHRCGDN